MIQPIKQFRVTRLTISGFKGYADQKTFQFGGMNVISGHMGVGKSSIADAIAFAITGVGFYAGAKIDYLYQYLLFALTQLQCGTPFQNSIWELTAIHFGQKRENVLACVRREIAHAFRMAPDRFSNERVGDVPARPPQSMAFLRLGLYMINRVVY